VSDDAERARTELRPRLGPLGGYESYQAVLAHGTVPSRTPVDVAAIGTEGEIADVLERLTAVGASELVAVVLPDLSDPAGSLGRARRLLGKLASEPPSAVAVEGP
jgi:hypothetical protein